MKFDGMDIGGFVEVTHTVRRGDKVGSVSVCKADAAAYGAYVVAHKQQIMEYLLEKERTAAQEALAAQERQAKAAQIEGLAELEAASEAVLRHREAFVRAWEQGDGVLPAAPQVTPEDVEALEKRYPRAAAYRKALSGSLAAHDVKAAAYSKALDRIINGEDYEKALADAEAEWLAYCNK